MEGDLPFQLAVLDFWPTPPFATMPRFYYWRTTRESYVSPGDHPTRAGSMAYGCFILQSPHRGN